MIRIADTLTGPLDFERWKSRTPRGRMREAVFEDPERIRSVRNLHGRELYAAYLKSPYWQGFRRSLLGDLGRWCRRCGVPTIRQRVELHHRHYETVGLERYSDILILCPMCHAREHDQTSGTWPATPQNARHGAEAAF